MINKMVVNCTTEASSSCDTRSRILLSGPCSFRERVGFVCGWVDVGHLLNRNLLCDDVFIAILC